MENSSIPYVPGIRISEHVSKKNGRYFQNLNITDWDALKEFIETYVVDNGVDLVVTERRIRDDRSSHYMYVDTRNPKYLKSK